MSDEELLRQAQEALEVLHAHHLGWGCNPANCSGVAALEAIAERFAYPKGGGRGRVTDRRLDMRLKENRQRDAATDEAERKWSEPLPRDGQ